MMTLTNKNLGAILFILLPFLCSCSKPNNEAPAAIDVVKPVKEMEIGITKLERLAVERLGIKTETVSSKIIPRHRIYGGEITVPPGQSAWINAPITGVVEASPSALNVGKQVKKGQLILSLRPQLTAESRAAIGLQLIEANGQVNSAESQLNSANAVYERAKKLYLDKVGSKKNADETEAAYEIAKQLHANTLSRRKFLQLSLTEGGPDVVKVLAAQSGILRNVSVMSGQSVMSGAALFELSNQSKLWLKVAIPSGDLPELARFDAVRIENFSIRSGTITIAQPVASAYIANASSASVDLMYEIKAPYESWIPGQRVNVIVPLHGVQGTVSVPWGAVIIDVTGGTWVYEELSIGQYKRRRISLIYVVDNQAVIDKTLNIGTKIVSNGAQELFSMETGFSH